MSVSASADGRATTAQRATFGAGCFWSVEEAFRRVPGVLDATTGYAGGATPDPTYDDVRMGLTGHVEVVQVTFDPAIVSYEDLLDVFWDIHDPTQRNRQGFDVGTQYRSMILTHDPEQDAAAQASRARLAATGLLNGPILTEILPAGDFHRAEEQHQRYIAKLRDDDALAPRN